MGFLNLKRKIYIVLFSYKTLGREERLESLFLQVIKIKNLLPSLKERKRYILYKISKKMEKYDIERALKEFVGELGNAKAGLRFIKHEGEKGIIQVNHKFVDEIKTGLALIYRPDLMIRTVRVSGSLNNLKEAR